MADKSIFDLTTQSTFANEDRLVIGNYANNDARAITGAQMVAQLTALADGHGGISSITAVESTADAGTNVITVTMADGSTSSFNVKNGSKGSTGLQTRVWIRYAHVQPTQNSDMGTTPDEWIGIATNTSSSAPSSYTSYTWYKYKGDKGDTGDTGKGVSNITASRTSGTGAPGTTDTYTATVTYTDSSTSSYTFQVYNGENGTGTGTVKAVSYNGTVYNSVDGSGTLALNDIQAQHSTITVTISTSDWNNGTCTKTASGVTASNTVIVSPASASFEAYGEAQVRATAQGTNQITFTCTDTPSSSLTVNIAIFD